jgi:hypothetical protein
MASGTITGGDVGIGGEPTLGGGAGVVMHGGTLIASGTITGGQGNSTVTAVDVAGGTLVLDPGAVFNGIVESAATGNETLSLAGTTAGTLSGFGTEFVGFPTISVAGAAEWTLTGANHTDATLVVDGNLAVTGTLEDGSRAFVGAGATLAVSGTGILTVLNLHLSGGTLDGTAGGAVSIGPTEGSVGAITLDADTGIHGFGTLTGAPVIDDGSIVAQSGTLTLIDAVSGVGKLVVGPDATLAAHAALGGTFVEFGGPGTLVLGDPAAVTAQMQGFATGDVIDLQGLVANTLSFSGGTLTLDDGSTPLVSLVFQGNYTSGDFILSSDHGSGTDIGFLAAQPEIATAAGATAPETGHIGQWDIRATPLPTILIASLAHHGLA